MPLSSPGQLAAAYPGFGRFLEGLEHAAPVTDSRFASRNFRLDERIPPERVGSYQQVGESSLQDLEEWYDAHGDYLAEALRIEQPPSGLPRNVFPEDSATCAEPFRTEFAVRDLAGTDASVDLVRVERLESIAADARVAADEVDARFAEASAASPTPDAVAWSDAVLGRWARTRDLRPMWAAFWEDCSDLLSASDSEQPNWPSILRDRLGLSGIDPAISARRIPIVAFRYPVRIVPTLRGDKARRCLAFPTVLDGSLSAAFCPTPSGGAWGRTVDLAEEVAEPFREVIHPPVRLRAHHICGVGTVALDAPPSLAEARGVHLLWLQDAFDRDDYGDGTDSDLFT